MRRKLLGWICKWTGHWFTFVDSWIFWVKTNERNRDMSATIRCRLCGETFVHEDAPRSETTVGEILRKHKIYAPDVELDLLRHFDRLRLEMLEGQRGD